MYRTGWGEMGDFALLIFLKYPMKIIWSHGIVIGGFIFMG